MRVLRFLVLNGIAVGLGASVASSCIAVNYPTVAFRCNPRQSDNCPETHTCCSDDPAARDGALPDFQGLETGGETPYFAGINNGLGTSGMCVRTGDIPVGSGLTEPAAANCPIPCNPSWSDGDIEAVCGDQRLCCQTTEIEPEDCVQDGDGNWRPAVGTDILANRSNWAPDRHVTHQDPGGTGCSTFTGATSVDDEDFVACINQLTVADQRGFCMAAQQCPTAAEGYLNACEQINMGLIAPPIAGA